MNRHFVAVLLMLSSAATLVGQPISELVVFGASSSSNGNFLAKYGFYPDGPYFEGRASDGVVWVEELADVLGVVRPMPSELGGTNYAWGGATTREGTYSFGGNLVVPNIALQVSEYLEVRPPRDDALHIMFGGWGDLFLLNERNASRIATNTSSSLSRLADAGASQFLVVNLPPIGWFPETSSPRLKEQRTELSVEFNQLLAEELVSLRNTYDAKFFEFDLFGLHMAVLEDPSSYGFVDVEQFAFDGESIVRDFETAMLIDNGHYSQTFHRLFGREAGLVAVPEPALNEWGLFAAAIIICRSRRRPRDGGVSALPA